MIPLPTKEQMEKMRIDAFCQRAIAGNPVESVDDLCMCRINKKGEVIFMTEQEYNKLWQDQN